MRFTSYVRKGRVIKALSAGAATVGAVAVLGAAPASAMTYYGNYSNGYNNNYNNNYRHDNDDYHHHNNHHHHRHYYNYYRNGHFYRYWW